MKISFLFVWQWSLRAAFVAPALLSAASSSIAQSVHFVVFSDSHVPSHNATVLSGSLPTSQPYNVSPWNYSGAENVASDFCATHADIVDWILAGLRTETDAGSKVATRACFLIKSDGSVVDLDSTSQVTFGVSAGSYYIVVGHWNHLAAMSANLVTLSSSSSLYDFTTAQPQAYGTHPMKDLGEEAFGMYAGDVNGNGQVQNDDQNDHWQFNVGLGTQVPA